MEKSKVYFTRKINPNSLTEIYKVLNVDLKGNVAVKLSTGEPGGNNYLKPELIKNLINLVNGTIVECNTAYGGNRMKTKDHLKAAKDHGFTDIAKVDIMDADGDIKLPVRDGKHLSFNYVGKNLNNYNSMLVLSYFKGHAMGGFGGAIKNISIGIASSRGKSWIHSAATATSGFGNNTKQDDFLESMAEAASSIIDYYKNDIIFINVVNNLSVDCDCDSNPAEPKMKDIGILASKDPIALDKACVDLVFNSNDPGKIDLIERINSRNGLHTLKYALKFNIGTLNYELVDMDN